MGSLVLKPVLFFFSLNINSQYFAVYTEVLNRSHLIKIIQGQQN